MAVSRAYGGVDLAGSIEASLNIVRGPADLLKAVKGARQDAMKAVGVYWHAHVLERHFDRRAFRLYGYRPRDPYYERRKARVKGTNRPLYWSGTLYATLKGNVQYTATPKFVAVRMSGGPKWLSGYLAFRGKKNTGPDKRKEITTVARREYEELALQAGRVFREAMNRVRDTQQSARASSTWIEEWG